MMTLIILTTLVISAAMGYALRSAVQLPGEAATWALCALMLVVGAGMGASLRRPQRGMRTALKNAAFTIVGTVVGSAVGGALAGVITGISLTRAIAVGSGYGWYTLSSVIISGMGDAQLGAVAFLSNIMREALAFIVIPLLTARKLGHLAISCAGATSMDTTLPIIARNDAQLGATAFLHGIALSTLVPFVVPFFYTL